MRVISILVLAGLAISIPAPFPTEARDLTIASTADKIWRRGDDPGSVRITGGTQPDGPKFPKRQVRQDPWETKIRVRKETVVRGDDPDGTRVTKRQVRQDPWETKIRVRKETVVRGDDPDGTRVTKRQDDTNAPDDLW